MNQKLFALLFVLLFCSISAHASTDDAADTSSNNLVNLIYYNHPGHVLFEPSFNSSINQGSFGNKESSNSVELFLSYGLPIDGLRISANATDGVNDYSNTGTSFSYTGVSNPNFTLSYRVIDAAPAGISSDVSFTLSPSTGTRTNAMIGSPGSDASGAPNLNVAATVFFTQSLNEVSLAGAFFHEFSGSGYDQTSSTTYSTNSYSEGSFTLVDRFHVIPKLFVQAEGRFLFSHTTRYVYPDTNGASQAYPFHVIPTFEVGYLHSKQFLITAFLSGYQYNETSIRLTTSAQTQNLVFSTNWGMRMTLEF